MSDESKKNSRTVLVYQLVYKGLFGRNRKVKSDSVRIAETPVDAPLDEEAVRALLPAAIAEIRPRGELTIAVGIDEVTYEDHESSDGYKWSSTAFMPFSRAYLFREVWRDGVKVPA